MQANFMRFFVLAVRLAWPGWAMTCTAAHCGTDRENRYIFSHRDTIILCFPLLLCGCYADIVPFIVIFS